MLVHELSFFAGGLAIGFIGTILGIGGGFLIVPALAYFEPSWSPRIVTAFSLAVVTANATSGAYAYRRARRLDVRSAVVFAISAAPGALIGILIGNRLTRGVFTKLFAVLLFCLSIWLVISPQARTTARGSTRRRLIDSSGKIYDWAFDMRIAVAACFIVGITSALFGIGGGPVMIPLLTNILNYPAHIATATSHGVLACTSLLATIVHIMQGDYRGDVPELAACAGGALIGAPAGARISGALKGALLLRCLAATLMIVALEMFTR